MKVFVTGSSGQLGHDVCKELSRRGIEHLGTNSSDLDITDVDSVKRQVTTFMPDVLIHCAAYTTVDKAEDEPEKCWSVNVDGTRNLAVACHEIGAKMLYISTDYVFRGEGRRAYEPQDLLGPLNCYGRSKLAGELVVQSLLEHFYIVRISWVFGSNGNNFVKTMLRLAQSRQELSVVCDQWGSPTYTADLAPLLCDIAATERYGIYHATNRGTCAWNEFAEEIFRQAGEKTVVHPILTEAYPAKATRPHNSRMDQKCLTENGFSLLPDWKDAVKRFLSEIDDKKEVLV